MDLHPDFRDPLAELVRCEVEFAILGGMRSVTTPSPAPRRTSTCSSLVSQRIWSA
jgi:hypothetical protein